MNERRRLALGTAQFGMKYGVFNRTGQPDADGATKILTYAVEAGLDTLDTAAAYGEAERRLGEIGVDSWRIVTKARPKTTTDRCAGEILRAEFDRSRTLLRVDRVSALLLHDSRELIGRNGLALSRALVSMRKEGLVDKIGVSIYSMNDFDQIHAICDIDIIQVPFNVVDQRVLLNGSLDRLAELGIEVHVRSVFLQGLLLMPPEARPAYFRRWRKELGEFDRYVAASRSSRLSVCLGIAKAQAAISRIVVGVEAVSQLREIISAFDNAPAVVAPELACSDVELIEPVNWR